MAQARGLAGSITLGVPRGRLAPTLDEITIMTTTSAIPPCPRKRKLVLVYSAILTSMLFAAYIASYCILFESVIISATNRTELQGLIPYQPETNGCRYYDAKMTSWVCLYQPIVTAQLYLGDKELLPSKYQKRVIYNRLTSR